jgi:uncharacterized protein YggE
MTFMPVGQRHAVEGLTVVGEATRDSLPDMIELGFDVNAAAFSAALAVQEIATKVNQIGQSLERVADGQVKVQSGGVAVWPLLAFPNSQFMPITTPALLPAAGLHMGNITSLATTRDMPQPVGYSATGSIKIAVQELARLGEIVDTVTAAGAVPNGSIRFLIRDEAALRRSLLEDAVNEAREKAKVLAAGFGKTPGNPISISEEFAAYQFQEVGRMPAGATRAPMPGPMLFCARVNVTYQLQ